MRVINSCALLGESAGKLVLVGAPPEALSFGAFPVLLGRKTITGSTIGENNL